MAAILGLLDSEVFGTDWRFQNWRRQILHQFPQGAAPLTGLLSMIGEEPTSDPVFHWEEKRFKSQRTTLRGTNPCTKTAPSSSTADDGTVCDAGATAITVDLYLKVVDATFITEGQVLQLAQSDQLVVVQTAPTVDSSTGQGYVKFRFVRAYTIPATPSTNAFAASGYARVIGSAHQEGGSGGYGTAAFRVPVDVTNQTQIHRDEFEFTGTGVKTDLKFDKAGPYKEKMKDTLIDHMIGLEKTTLFGRRSKTTVTDPRTSRQAVRRTMSGIVEFLELWDAGSTGLTVDGSTLAPFSDHAAATVDTDDYKRVIGLSSGVMTEKFFLQLLERICRYRSNKSNDKLALCGSGAMLVFHEMFRKCTTTMVDANVKVYGMDFIQYKSPFGSVFFRTHPLMNDDPTWRYWVLIVDVWSLKYRLINGRDTQLLKHRQLPNEDLRRDEFLTEIGLEMHFPEGNLLIKNVQSFGF